MIAQLLRCLFKNILFFVVLSLVIVLCGWGCTKDDPIRIGFVGPLKGNYSDLGVQGRNGAQLAMETINNKGGVAGRQLELLVRNDNGMITDALEADRELMRQKVVAVVGHMLSAQSLAAVQEFADESLIFLSPTTSTPLLTGKNDNFFRVMPANQNWAAALAVYATVHMGKPMTLMLIDDNNKGYTVPFCKAFAERYAQLSGETIEQHFSSGSSGWQEKVLARLAADKPQALLVAASARDTASLARRLRLAHQTLPILTTPWAYTKEVIDLGGSAVEGMITSMSFDENSNLPEFIAFKEAYLKRFGREPSFFAAFAYDAVLALADALSRTGGKPEGLPRELVRVQNLQGAMGPFSIDENGDVKRQYFIVTVKSGKLHTLSLEPSGTPAPSPSP